MQQAERGWAGNKGRLGRVGETTASSHQHRCRYRIIVVCYCRAFRENDKRYIVPCKFWQPVRLLAKKENKEKERYVNESKLKGKNDKR